MRLKEDLIYEVRRVIDQNRRSETFNRQPSIMINMPDVKQGHTSPEIFKSGRSDGDLRVEDYIDGIPDQGQVDIPT